MAWHLSREPDNAVTDPPLDIRLNRQWRVTADRYQWILERRGGKGGWTESAFVVTPACLLAVIRERCGPVEAAPLAKIAGWPPYFSIWAVRRNGWYGPEKQAECA